MKFDYRTDASDYIDFYEFNARNTPAGRKSMMIQKLAVPVILLLVTVCTWALGAKPVLILIQLVLYAIFSFLWARYQDKTIRSNAENLLQKLEKKGQTPYSREGTIDFGEKEIRDQRSNQTLTLYYTDIASVYENRGTLYIYMAEGKRVVLLPAAVLEKNNRKAELLDLLRQKIAPEKFFTA